MTATTNTREGASALREYLDEVGKNAPLSAEQERALILLAQAGDGSALNELMAHNQRLILHLAGRYRRYGAQVLDLAQDGNIGLMQAVRRFDAGRGVRLSTYAVRWIIKAMRAGLARAGWPVRRPAKVLDAQIKMLAAEAALRARLGREPSRGEVAAAARLTERQVDNARMALIQVESLDEPAPGEGLYAADERLAAVDEPTVEDAALDRAAVSQLAGYLNELPAQQAEVLRLRYWHGLDGPETARRLGIAKQAVHQAERAGLERLRLRMGTADWLLPEERPRPRQRVRTRRPESAR